MTAVLRIETEETHVSALKAWDREVKAAETSAAVAAWHAGDEALKLIETYGWSQARVSRETGITRRTLDRYQKVRGARQRAGDIAFGETINEIIGEESAASRIKKARAATFGTTEAEYAMKLARLAVSDVNEHEAAVAQSKLDKFAADHGMSAEEMQAKATKMLGLDKEPLSPFDKAVEGLMEPYRKMPKDKLIEVLLFCISEHIDLYAKLKEKFNA